MAENHPLACPNFENLINLIRFRVFHRERRVGSRNSSRVVSNVEVESQSLKNRDSAQPLKKTLATFSLFMPSTLSHKTIVLFLKQNPILWSYDGRPCLLKNRSPHLIKPKQVLLELGPFLLCN